MGLAQENERLPEHIRARHLRALTHAANRPCRQAALIKNRKKGVSPTFLKTFATRLFGFKLLLL